MALATGWVGKDGGYSVFMRAFACEGAGDLEIEAFVQDLERDHISRTGLVDRPV